MPDMLRQVLRDGGFGYDETVRNWRDRGWLWTTPGATTRTLQVRLGGSDHRVRVVAITLEAVNAIVGPEPATEARPQPRPL